MEVLAVGAKSEVERVLRKVALGVDQGVVLATPVDTGRARANWIVTTGAASQDMREPIETGDAKSESRRSANTELSLSQGRSEIGKYDVRKGPIFISNNVAYIEQLENGSSKQAPKGMLRTGVQVGQAIAKIERINLTRVRE